MPKIGVISIYVTDIELAKQFYCDKLGFEVHRVFDPTTVKLAHDGIAVVLCQTEAITQVQYPSQAQVVFGIETEELERTIEELTAKGISMIYEQSPVCPGGHYNAFRDPFGNVIELL
ncbi:VOC family protein [Paenibacillus sp. N1-5-1-14]|uniref:VOC family protein n=1 Tax=Paenibacillus radicibacter TaxID=2972488 RepID=UPI0021597812|nr:VOC family protein [Paenibacillus radicibacter]MCR8644352.1 VOC family protein [Paenibacillus radicibacter]